MRVHPLKPEELHGYRATSIIASRGHARMTSVAHIGMNKVSYFVERLNGKEAESYARLEDAIEHFNRINGADE